MKRILRPMLLALSLLAFSAAGADAGMKKLGIAGFTFLKVSQGARAVGMGDAFTAVANDVDAIFWNPAGLTHIQRPSYTFSYTSWIAGCRFYSGAIAHKMGNHRLGLSVVAFRPDAFEETTIFKPQGTGTMVQDSDIAIGLAYAIQFTDRLSFGAKLRYIQESLFLDTHRSVDFSIGTLFYTGFGSMRLAMSLRNFGADVEIIDDKAFMPLVYSIALATELYGKVGDPVYLTASAENTFFVDYEGRVHTGAELWLANTLALRGGWKFNYDTESFSVGLGLKRKLLGERAFSVDFSYSDMGDLLDPAYRLSVGGSF